MLSDRSLLGCTLSDFVDGNLFELAHRFFWISDASMGLFSVGFLRGSVFAGCLCASGGVVPSLCLMAVVVFLCEVAHYSFCWAGSSLMPSAWLFAAVVTFAVG